MTSQDRLLSHLERQSSGPCLAARALFGSVIGSWLGLVERPPEGEGTNPGKLRILDAEAERVQRDPCILWRVAWLQAQPGAERLRGWGWGQPAAGAQSRLGCQGRRKSPSPSRVSAPDGGHAAPFLPVGRAGTTVGRPLPSAGKVPRGPRLYGARLGTGVRRPSTSPGWGLPAAPDGAPPKGRGLARSGTGRQRPPSLALHWLLPPLVGRGLGASSGSPAFAPISPPPHSFLGPSPLFPLPGGSSLSRTHACVRRERREGGGSGKRDRLRRDGLSAAVPAPRGPCPHSPWRRGSPRSGASAAVPPCPPLLPGARCSPRVPGPSPGRPPVALLRNCAGRRGPPPVFSIVQRIYLLPTAG
ncbi:uncharacterized protein ACOB8E_017689 [Sarcophilus harrisii]